MRAHNGLERKVQRLEDTRRGFRPEPSPEVHTYWSTKYQEAYLALGEAARDALDEAGIIVYGAFYDDQGNFQGLEADAEVHEALEHLSEVMGDAWAAGVRFLADDLPYQDERCDFALKAFQAWRSDTAGTPWEGPLAKNTEPFRENPMRPGPRPGPRS